MPHTNRNLHNYIAGAIALIAIIAVGAYLFMNRGTDSVGSNATSTATTTTNVDGVTVAGGTATVTENSGARAPAAPNYKTPLSFSATMDEAVKLALQKQFDATVSMIDKDKTSFQGWVNLGIIRKMVGDYKGAEAAWKYVVQIYPSSTVGFDNLGALYLDFIKDYAKAEAMFKQSITLDSHDINAYQQLFSLYTTYGYKQGAAVAAELLAAGLKANPGNETLLQLQSQLSAQ